MKIKTVILSFIVSFLFWTGMNSSLNIQVLTAGLIISAVLTLFFLKTSFFEDVRISPRAFIAFLAWLLTFLAELVKSNIDVMLRVITPKVRINPAIVEVRTRLKSKLGRLVLANSITLTPGTLTVDIIGDRLYIHWIDASLTDVEGATKQIVEKFEKHLEVIFG